MHIENNILKHYLKNVYFITGTAYAGKSTTVKMLAERYDMVSVSYTHLKLKHPQEVLEIGEKVKVKILSMNEEKGKISLGLKQTVPEPWSVIDENYQVGQVVSGKVVQIKEYGAFVELEPGLDGLVHICLLYTSSEAVSKGYSPCLKCGGG